jgi:hypothetical protein
MCRTRLCCRKACLYTNRGSLGRWLALLAEARYAALANGKLADAVKPPGRRNFVAFPFGSLYLIRNKAILDASVPGCSTGEPQHGATYEEDLDCGQLHSPCKKTASARGTLRPSWGTCRFWGRDTLI